MSRRLTEKQKRLIAFVETHPGATAADLHRAIGRDYAHGHHKFTYASVSRLKRAKVFSPGKSASGRGVGLYLQKLESELKKL